MKRSPPSAAAPAAKKAKKEKPKLLRGEKREARMRAEAQNMRRNNSTLRKFTLAERAQFGHLYAKDIVEQLETMCDDIAESPALEGKFYEPARANVYEDYRGYAKKVLSFFRRYCDRRRLMQGLLETHLPWRTIKDPALEQDHDYLKWERQHFNDTVEDGKIRLQDYSVAVRSDPECVVLALVSAGPELSDIWQHAKVEPTLDFAECVYGEFFTECNSWDKESLKYVEEFLVEKLGVTQDKVNEIKETLW